MGTFAGHALPGSFFIYFGLWACFHQLQGYYRRLLAKKQGKLGIDAHDPMVSGAYPVKWCCGSRFESFPIDSILKVVLCLVGIIGEAYTGLDASHTFVHYGNAQHITMYSFFAAGGIYELVVLAGWFRAPVLLEQFFIWLAMVGEATLFLFHLHGRTPVDIFVHMLLAGVMVLAVVAGLLLFTNPRRCLFGLVVIWTILMQGTWFWQVGAVLYPAASWMPVWDENAIESIPRAANLFCYHLLVDFAVIVLMAVGFSIYYKLPRGVSAADFNPVASDNVEMHSHQLPQSLEPEDEDELWAKPSGANTANDGVLILH